MRAGVRACVRGGLPNQGTRCAVPLGPHPARPRRESELSLPVSELRRGPRAHTSRRLRARAPGDLERALPRCSAPLARGLAGMVGAARSALRLPAASLKRLCRVLSSVERRSEGTGKSGTSAPGRRPCTRPRATVTSGAAGARLAGEHVARSGAGTDGWARGPEGRAPRGLREKNAAERGYAEGSILR